MKKELTSVLTGAALTLGNLSIGAPAIARYKSHEHAFYNHVDIKGMNQTYGNRFCRLKFYRLRNKGYIRGFNAYRVNHVWAHIKNGDCVANTW